MPELPHDSPLLEAIRPAYQRARLVGLVLCVAWPLFLMVLVGAEAVKPGTAPVEGAARQIGYTFTALTFLIAAFVTWRSGRVLKGFKALAPEERPRTVLRESLVYAVLFELSCLWGLLYWMLVGRNAFQHVLTFMALTPLMFFLFVPRLDAWKLALERED
ncbi:MAG TPA: hypothetical protein VJ483_10390 [Holophagaceae bacterium]|nr:hypothetical protein [Holophagaceae bacterium]